MTIPDCNQIYKVTFLPRKLISVLHIFFSIVGPISWKMIMIIGNYPKNNDEKWIVCASKQKINFCNRENQKRNFQMFFKHRWRISLCACKCVCLAQNPFWTTYNVTFISEEEKHNNINSTLCVDWKLRVVWLWRWNDCEIGNDT